MPDARQTRRLRAVLGGVRAAWGVSALVSPAANLRVLAIRPVDPVDGHYLSRLFATRELSLGLLQSGAAGQDAARISGRLGVATDAIDLVSLAIAHRRGKVSAPAAAVLGVLGVGAVAAGVLVSKD